MHGQWLPRVQEDLLHLPEDSRLLEAREQRPCPEKDCKPHCLGFSLLVSPGWEEQRCQPSFGLCAKHPYARRNQFLRWGGDNFSEFQVPPAPIIRSSLQRQQWMLGCPQHG